MQSASGAPSPLARTLKEGLEWIHHVIKLKLSQRVEHVVDRDRLTSRVLAKIVGTVVRPRRERRKRRWGGGRRVWERDRENVRAWKCGARGERVRAVRVDQRMASLSPPKASGPRALSSPLTRRTLR